MFLACSCFGLRCTAFLSGNTCTYASSKSRNSQFFGVVLPLLLLYDVENGAGVLRAGDKMGRVPRDFGRAAAITSTRFHRCAASGHKRPNLHRSRQVAAGRWGFSCGTHFCLTVHTTMRHPGCGPPEWGMWGFVSLSSCAFARLQQPPARCLASNPHPPANQWQWAAGCGIWMSRTNPAGYGRLG